MAKTKVLIDGQVFNLQGERGISRYFYELMNEFNNQGLDYTLVSGLNSNRFGSPIFRIALPKVISVIIYYFIISFRELFSSANVIHRTYYLPSLIPKRKTEVLTVFDMNHELYPQYYGFKGVFTRFCKKRSIFRCDKIIAISQNTKNDLVSIYGVDPDKISVIYLGVSDNFYTKSISGSVKKPFFLFVGPRGRHKNFKNFYKAFLDSKYSVTHDIVCVGGKSFNAEETLEYPRARHVFANDAELNYLYSTAFAFIYPSVYEGFGLPIIEAMRLKCPVLCSNNSSVGEIASEYAVTFDPGSIENITDTLNSFSPTAYDCERAYVYSLKYNWHETSIRTRGIYGL